MTRSEYQAWLARERRKDRVRRWISLVIVAVLLAVGMYGALVGFVLFFGGD